MSLPNSTAPSEVFFFLAEAKKVCDTAFSSLSKELDACIAKDFASLNSLAARLDKVQTEQLCKMLDFYRESLNDLSQLEESDSAEFLLSLTYRIGCDMQGYLAQDEDRVRKRKETGLVEQNKKVANATFLIYNESWIYEYGRN
jgi:hypothetical protein